MHDIMIVLLCMLACAAPTTAFAGLNARFFSHRQIILSITIAAVFGLTVGIACVGLPATPWVVSLVAGLCFLALSERFFCETFTGIRLHAVKFGTLVLLVLPAYPWGLLPPLSLFVVYATAALWDLKKHWNDQKSVVFVEHVSQGHAPIQNADKIKLERRPNIYLFFLESFHSREALNAVYGMDDPELYAVLEELGFTNYPDSFSNSISTLPSLYNILYMQHYQNIKSLSMPTVLSILKNNGYKINFFDLCSYVFGNYSIFADYFNFALPLWVRRIYETMGPLFSQSRYLRALTCNIDPFITDMDAQQIFAALKGTTASTKAPQCNLIRFGAAHYFSLSGMDARGTWTTKYKRLYAEASKDLQEILRWVREHDPDALIAAVGDHGGHSYIKTWEGAGTPCDNLRARGLEPALVTRDIMGIICAVYWPKGCLAAPAPLMPVTLFRSIFHSLGAAGISTTPQAQAVSIVAGHWVAVRDGHALPKWEKRNHNEVLNDILERFDQEPGNPENQLSVAAHLEETGQPVDAYNFLRKLDNHQADPDMLLHMAHLSCKIGLPSVTSLYCARILKEAPDNGNAHWLMAKSFILQGRPAAGLAYFKQHTKQITHAHLVAQDIELNLLILAGDHAAAEVKAKEYALHTLPYGIMGAFRENAAYPVVTYAWLLDQRGRTNKALSFLIEHLNWEKFSTYPYHWHSHAAAALFCAMRLGLWEKAEGIARRYLAIIPADTPAVILCLAGSLEMQGRQTDALKVLANALQKGNAPQLYAHQLGLFSLRNRIANGNLADLLRSTQTRLKSEKAVWARDPVFDATWYEKRYAMLLNTCGMRPSEHFAHYRQVLLLDPCRFFHSGFFLTQKTTLLSSHDPVLRYLNASPYDDMEASLDFNRMRYLCAHSEPGAQRRNPLREFMQQLRRSSPPDMPLSKKQPEFLAA